MEIDAALDLVSRRGWLSQTPRAFRNALLARVHLQTFTEGEIIYEAGDPPGGIYGVVSGAVRISFVPWGAWSSFRALFQNWKLVR